MNWEKSGHLIGNIAIFNPYDQRGGSAKGETMSTILTIRVGLWSKPLVHELFSIFDNEPPVFQKWVNNYSSLCVFSTLISLSRDRLPSTFLFSRHDVFFTAKVQCITGARRRDIDSWIVATCLQFDNSQLFLKKLETLPEDISVRVVQEVEERN